MVACMHINVDDSEVAPSGPRVLTLHLQKGYLVISFFTYNEFLRSVIKECMRGMKVLFDYFSSSDDPYI